MTHHHDVGLIARETKFNEEQYAKKMGAGEEAAKAKASKQAHKERIAAAEPPKVAFDPRMAEIEAAGREKRRKYAALVEGKQPFAAGGKVHLIGSEKIRQPVQQPTVDARKVAPAEPTQPYVVPGRGITEATGTGDLYQIKGRTWIRCVQVPAHVDAMNSGDVFVYDCQQGGLFVWCT